MRTAFETEDADRSLEVLSKRFEQVASDYRMDWSIHSAKTKPRVLILVSRTSHCFVDLLHRHHTGMLNIEIPAVVSNHEDLRSLAEFYKVPFHYCPVSHENRQEQEAQILDIVSTERIDLVILARYMQVLSDNFCRTMEGRVINIHHSFLPSFKGARPYHQAHERGVKIIGATAHYVTSDLDEGPIIEQQVRRVTHECSPDELVQLGSDIEAHTLAKGVRAHIEHRVFMNGKKTVVF